MEVEAATPGRGSQTSAAWFKQQLAELGYTQASFGRYMLSLGDDRKIETIDRNIRRMSTGEARVSGEMRALLGLLRQRQAG